MRYRKLASLIGIGVLIALLCSCTASTSLLTNESSLPPADHSSSAKVVVTSDFGKEIFIEEIIVISENTTALDALQQVAGVETKYGEVLLAPSTALALNMGELTSRKRTGFSISMACQPTSVPASISFRMATLSTGISGAGASASLCRR